MPLKIGDVIVFGESERQKVEGIDITIGKLYQTVGEDATGDLYFIDDAGDKNFSTNPHPVYGAPTAVATKVVF